MGRPNPRLMLVLVPADTYSESIITLVEESTQRGEYAQPKKNCESKEHHRIEPDPRCVHCSGQGATEVEVLLLYILCMFDVRSARQGFDIKLLAFFIRYGDRGHIRWIRVTFFFVYWPCAYYTIHIRAAKVSGHQRRHLTAVTGACHQGSALVFLTSRF